MAKKPKPGKAQLDALMKASPSFSVWRVGIKNGYQKKCYTESARPVTESYPRFKQSLAWGVVAAASQNIAFEVAEVLDCCEAVPGGIGYIACFSDRFALEALKEHEKELFGKAGATLLFDGAGTFETEPLVANDCLNYDKIVLRASPYRESSYEWYGKVPASYIANEERRAKGDALCDAIDSFVYDCTEYGVDTAEWCVESTLELVRELSHGRLEPLDLEQPAYREPKVKCGYRASQDPYDAEYGGLFKPYLDVVRLWTGTLEHYGVMICEYAIEAGKDTSGLLELGGILGIDNAMDAYFEHGIPMEDVLL